MKSIKRIAESTLNKAYEVGRKTGWAFYTILPAIALTQADKIMNFVSSYSRLNPLRWGIELVNSFSGDPYATVENMKELGEKGLGFGTGMLASKVLNSKTERYFPTFKRTRSSIEAAGYASLAVGAKIAADNDLGKETLEDIVDIFSSEESIADALAQTFETTANTINYISTPNYNSTLQEVLYFTTATLSVLALKRFCEIFKRGPITRARDRIVYAEHEMRKALKGYDSKQ